MKPARDVYRITLKHGKVSKKLVVCEGPVPEVGDACTFQGVDWEVSKVEKDKLLFAFERQGAKLKQVFP